MGVQLFTAFHQRFPEIGVTETRSVQPFNERGERDVFLFLELYCDEVGCDCRRVLVRVCSVSEPAVVVASLSFGWEPEQFYRDWSRRALKPYEIADLKGPGLQLLAPQSDRAEEMLVYFQKMLDVPSYVERIKRHYASFRATIAAPIGNRESRRAARRNRG